MEAVIIFIIVLAVLIVILFFFTDMGQQFIASFSNQANSTVIQVGPVLDTLPK